MGIQRYSRPLPQPSWQGFAATSTGGGSGTLTNAAGVVEMFDALGTGQRIHYTPTVAGVFKFRMQGIVFADDAAWVRTDLQPRIRLGSDDTVLASTSVIAYCHTGGPLYTSYSAEIACNVSAGIHIYGQPCIYVQSGTFHYWQGRDYMSHTAWFTPS